MKTSRSKPHRNEGNSYATHEFEPKTVMVKFRCTKDQKFQIEKNADEAGFSNVSEYALAKLL